MYAIKALATCTIDPLQIPTSDFNAIRFSFTYVNKMYLCIGITRLQFTFDELYFIYLIL